MASERNEREREGGRYMCLHPDRRRQEARGKRRDADLPLIHRSVARRRFGTPRTWIIKTEAPRPGPRGEGVAFASHNTRRGNPMRSDDVRDPHESTTRPAFVHDLVACYIVESLVASWRPGANNMIESKWASRIRIPISQFRIQSATCISSCKRARGNVSRERLAVALARPPRCSQFPCSRLRLRHPSPIPIRLRSVALFDEESLFLLVLVILFSVPSRAPSFSLRCSPVSRPLIPIPRRRHPYLN
ncbi:hypothetical protein K438DRAFT_920867 [Mycena galopus ATCC 62051]|nr:hypothetical protein K438DRAFT_920867 [Mycena galopus ATCC 62051]